MHVVISRVKDELRVSVPYAWKDRAKKIKEYRWSPDLKVWIYPYSRATFSELVAEFGDNATVEGVDIPPGKTPPEPNVPQAIEGKLREIEAQLISAEKQAQKLARDNQELREQVSELTRQLAEKQSKLQSAEEVKGSIEFWKQKAEENEKKYLDLVTKSTQPTPQPRRVISIADPLAQLVQRSIAIAKNDAAFQQTVKSSSPSRLPLDLASAAEKKLRLIFAKNGDGNPKSDFVTLIREASDKHLISDEARVLLNFVRQNRNRVAHDQLDQAVLWARSCLAVLASAILWPILENHD